MKQTDKNSLLKNRGLEKTVNALMEVLPYTFYCFRIEREIVLADNSDNLEYSWGITVSEDDAGELGLEIQDHLEFIPASKCVSAVIVSADGDLFTKSALQFMLDHVDEQGYSIGGDVIGKLMLTENRDGKKRSYLEVNIPVS